MSVDAYAELIARVQRAYTVATVGDLLEWDEQVNLPSGAAEQRAAQLAVIAELQHDLGSHSRIGELLRLLEPRSDLDAAQRVVLANIRRDYDRATRLPAEFVREKAMLGSRGFHAWAQAKAANDFAPYAPVLEANLGLARREANYLGWSERPYDYMIDKFDPGLSSAVIADLFTELKRDLVPFVARILRSPTAAQARSAARQLRGFPVDAQARFLREITSALGFDYTRGRIDTSLHPFCSGSGADVRLTTRYHEDLPLDALFSSIHEAGHGLYEQGLPRAAAGTALGIAAGMGMHESQSRLWENQVARSRGFWRHFEPRWREVFGERTRGVSSDVLYLAVNAVEPTLIRVDADEVTYNLHIILRFEIEQRLFTGDLAVRDLPAAWRAASRELLGLEPETDREGVLQDVHWSNGSFGYFPSYCLGNMIAAQLWHRVSTLRPDLETDFARGDFSWLLGWLRENIHAHGRRYGTLELVQRATGEPLSPRYLMRYLVARYGALYGVDASGT
jgi:carboxypeptidase Taq